MQNYIKNKHCNIINFGLEGKTSRNEGYSYHNLDSCLGELMQIRRSISLNCFDSRQCETDVLNYFQNNTSQLGGMNK